MKEKKPKKDYFFYLGILGIVLFLILLCIYAIHFNSLTPEWLQYFFRNASNDPADWGTFGDFLGGTLNPIFGLLGFMALIRTLSLQRQQLDDQRQAMQQQQEDMEAQRESLAISNKTQIKQQFEGTFFKLFNPLFHDINELEKKSLAIEYPYKKDRPQHIPEIFYFLDKAFKEKSDTHKQTIKKMQSRLGEISNLSGSVFLQFYKILIFCDKSIIEDADKKFYINLVLDNFSVQHKLLLIVYIYSLREAGEERITTEYIRILEKIDFLDEVLVFLNKCEEKELDGKVLKPIVNKYWPNSFEALKTRNT